MNRTHRLPDIDELLDQFSVMASNKDVYGVKWYAWPCAFGSTAGPKQNVVAGQAITLFQVYAFDNEMGDKFKWCNGVWKNWDGVIDGRW